MDMKMIDEGLYRLYVPFEDIATAVFFAVYDGGTVIIDTATYPQDADNYIIPALAELGIDREAVKYMALTHKHGDHAGGASRLSELLPWACILSPEPKKGVSSVQLNDGEVLLGGMRAICLAGHTDRSFGFYDIKTRTLFSGDCLQLGGIGRYTNGIKYPELYLASVEKLRGMDIERIVASHEYVPLGSTAEGKKAVKIYLDTCEDIARKTEWK